jgi:hypothetical protein
MNRPIFTLRDLFWLILVVGMALGWWSHTYRLRLERDFALTERAVMDVLGCDAMPWMVAATELHSGCRVQFNQAFSKYANASEGEREQMASEALRRIGSMRRLPE